MASLTRRIQRHMAAKQGKLRLCQRVPGLSKRQAGRILKSAKEQVSWLKFIT